MFDDIRPYYDAEINAAMQRISEDPLFSYLSHFVFPDHDVQEIKEMVKGIHSSEEFQKKVMYVANERIIEESISEFTYSGLENLEKGKAYLFVSNHRDIMLDASLLQNILLDNGFETSEITFGANLMHPSLVVDIGKSNKMFKVERPGSNMKEFYRSSTHLSDYIRTTILEKAHSVWIAQRNGRTKDGIDRTDVGIIKMFSMSRNDDAIKSLSELNIAPISVSYEWEPCDVAKAIELWHKSQGPYIKRAGEDLESILSGILRNKGRVHFHICAPITENELRNVHEKSLNAYYRNVAGIIDRRICSAYQLYPNNYLAHDMLENNSTHKGNYSEEDIKHFNRRLEDLSKINIGFDEVQRIFLGIYANPVDSKSLFIAK